MIFLIMCMIMATFYNGQTYNLPISAQLEKIFTMEIYFGFMMETNFLLFEYLSMWIDVPDTNHGFNHELIIVMNFH